MLPKYIWQPIFTSFTLIFFIHPSEQPRLDPHATIHMRLTYCVNGIPGEKVQTLADCIKHAADEESPQSRHLLGEKRKRRCKLECVH